MSLSIFSLEIDSLSSEIKSRMEIDPVEVEEAGRRGSWDMVDWVAHLRVYDKKYLKVLGFLRFRARFLWR